MDIFASLSHYVQFYPLAAFIGLLLAGLNIPVSEDLVVITGALICQEKQDLIVPTLLAIYAGVIISDYMCYYIGVFARRGVLNLKFAAALFSPKNLDWVRRHLDKHGHLTFIVCRFIPFGVRNTLFMTSGFLGLPLRRFTRYDIPAVFINTNALFFLVYHFGDAGKSAMRVAGIVLLILLSCTVLALLIRLITKYLSSYGLPQAAVYPSLTAAAMAVLFVVFGPVCWIIPLEAALFLVLVWMLSFFRNPSRRIIPDESVLYSPADGKVTDISTVEDEELGPMVRIGIFLSIFNVHLNRAPCQARVERILYKKGMFKDARSPESTRVNESNTLVLTRLAEPCRPLMVRQVSGAIARRIVCRTKAGDELKQGQLFGMIKFGSRTELYLPAENTAAGGDDGKNAAYEITVQIGDKVQAGLSPLVRYHHG